MNTTYIQRRDRNGVETVDESDDAKEAHRLLAEYRVADPYAEYYLSSRACREWRESDREGRS